MFRAAFRAGRSVLATTCRSYNRFTLAAPSFLALGLIYSEYQRQRSVHNATQPTEKAIVIENDAVYLNKQTYMEKLLGNKRENYILIVYGQENDEDTRASIKTAKHLKAALRQSGVAMNVYVVSRPTIENVRQIANRILDFPVFEKESDPKQVEVYFKTIHSTDYVYFKWRKESFFTPHKTQKFIKKISRYSSLFHSITVANDETEKQLALLLQRQYIRLDEPVILKCASVPASTASAAQKKQHTKDVKAFKKLCFFSAERKLIPLKSQFILLENKEIMKTLNLEDGQVYILRNDILQKLQSSQEITLSSEASQTQQASPTTSTPRLVIDDSFLYLQNQRNSSGVNEKLHFFSAKLESLEQFKTKNPQLLKNIDTLSREQGTASSGEELDEMKDQAVFINFVMPRITFLRDSKFGNIGKLFKKITFAKEKRVLSLNLTSADKTKNHSRLITLKKLHEAYHREFTFLLVDSDSQIVDLFPHLDVDQPQFSLFNFFNLDKSALSRVGKYYKHLIFPFEKYFLEDNENLHENIDTISKKIDTILIDESVPKDFVINQTDMIPTISSTILDQLIQQSQEPFLVQVLHEGFDSSTPVESVDANSLARYTLNQFLLDRLKAGSNAQDEQQPVKGIFRMSHLNQHHFLKDTTIHSDAMPLYVFVDPKSKKVILSQAKEPSSKQASKQELVQFLQVCQDAGKPIQIVSPPIIVEEQSQQITLSETISTPQVQPVIEQSAQIEEQPQQVTLEVQSPSELPETNLILDTKENQVELIERGTEEEVEQNQQGLSETVDLLRNQPSQEPTTAEEQPPSS